MLNDLTSEKRAVSDVRTGTGHFRDVKFSRSGIQCKRTDSCHMISDFTDLENGDFDEAMWSWRGSKKRCPVCECAYLRTKNDLLRMVIATCNVCHHSRKSVAYFAAASDNIQGLSILNNSGIDLRDGVEGAVAHGKWRSFCWLQMILGAEFDAELSHEEMFTCACRGGNVNIMEYLLGLRPDFKNKVEKCFSVAAENGHVEMVEMFLRMDCPSVECVSKSCVKSIRLGNCGMVKLMLEYLSSKHSLKIPEAISAAIESKNTDALLLLLERGISIPANYNAWKGALKSNSLQTLQILINSGKLDINYQDQSSKETALHVAAEMGNVEAVKLLCQVKGIKKDLKDSRVSLSFIGFVLHSPNSHSTRNCVIASRNRPDNPSQGEVILITNGLSLLDSHMLAWSPSNSTDGEPADSPKYRLQSFSKTHGIYNITFIQTNI